MTAREAQDGTTAVGHNLTFDAAKVVPVGDENKPASVSLRFLIKAQ